MVDVPIAMLDLPGGTFWVTKPWVCHGKNGVKSWYDPSSKSGLETCGKPESPGFSNVRNPTGRSSSLGNWCLHPWKIIHFGKKQDGSHQVVSCSPQSSPYVCRETPKLPFLISSTSTHVFFFGYLVAGMSFRELRNFCEMMRSLGYHRLVSMASRRS